MVKQVDTVVHMSACESQMHQQPDAVRGKFAGGQIHGSADGQEGRFDVLMQKSAAAQQGRCMGGQMQGGARYICPPTHNKAIAR